MEMRYINKKESHGFQVGQEVKIKSGRIEDGTLFQPPCGTLEKIFRPTPYKDFGYSKPVTLFTVDGLNYTHDQISEVWNWMEELRKEGR